MRDSDQPQDSRDFDGILTADDLKRLVHGEQATIHPQREWIAFTRQYEGSDGPRSRIHVVDRRGQDQDLRVGDQTHSPAWSHDGTMMVYITEHSGQAALDMISMDTGRIHTLARFHGHVRNPVWSPDNTHLAVEVLAPPYESDSPHIVRRLRYMLNGYGYIGTEYWQIMIVNILDGTHHRLGPKEWPHMYPAWAPDGKSLAVVTTRRPDWDLEWIWDVYTVSTDGQNWSKRTASDGFSMMPEWSRSGEWILYFHNHCSTTGTTKDYHLMAVPTNGSTAPRCLTHNEDRGAMMAEPPDLGHRPVELPGNRWLWVANLNSHQTLMCTDLDGFTSIMQSDVSWPQTVNANGVAGLLALHHDRPAEIAFLDVTAKDPHYEEVTTLNPWLSELTVAREAPTNITLPSFDDNPHTVSGWFWRPAFGAPPYPTLLHFHGGPHGSAVPYFGFLESLALANGFAVASVNFRGSAGFGQEYADIIHGNWGPQETQDGHRFLSHLTEIGLADPTRLGVYGGSYGGFLTNWLISHYPNAVQAAVTMSTISDLAVLAYGIDHWESIATDAGGYPADFPDLYLANSPITQANAITAPLLILHGDEDATCPPIQAEMLFVALRWQKKAVEWVRYPGEHHGIMAVGTLAHRIDAMFRVIDWFNRHLLKNKSL